MSGTGARGRGAGLPDDRVIAVDLAALRREDGSFRTMLAWGDRVRVLEEEEERLKVAITDFEELEDGSVRPKESHGYVKRRTTGRGGGEVAVPAAEPGVLRVDFVDVQQGDGGVIQTPAGRVVTIDGGDNQLFARYLASRFRGTTEAEPKEIDAMVVTHGDADHFAGLAEIHDSETHSQLYKRIFVHPARVFHNGLVKRPSTRREAESLGAAEKVGEETIITGLEEDLLAVPESEMNMPFRAWRKALQAWRERGGPIEFRRLEQGDDDAFGFLADEGIEVAVLGPILTEADGVRGLRFLGAPREGAPVGPADDEAHEFGGLDASHTINGHSIVLRLRFGGWRFLFAGDLNAEAEQSLTAAHNRGDLDLRSEVFKVPHHGSADFSHPFLRSVSPVLSVVSSGDESARKEYVHPRATLVGALGMHSRETASVVLVTELVAFFEAVGWAKPTEDGASFYAFRRSAFGIVRVRTDGNRLLVYTDSGKRDLKEAYAFELSPAGEVVPAEVRRA